MIIIPGTVPYQVQAGTGRNFQISQKIYSKLVPVPVRFYRHLSRICRIVATINHAHTDGRTTNGRTNE